MIVTSQKLKLRLVDVRDANFIAYLRKERGQYLSASGDVASQINFIKQYKNREQERVEFYFIISDYKSDIGVVRIYDIDYSSKNFTWGSWIMLANRAKNAPLESFIISHFFAFKHLSLQLSNFDVRIHNYRAIAFYRKTNAQFVGEDNDNLYLIFSEAMFDQMWQKYRLDIGNVKIL